MNREEVYELLTEYTKSERLLRHSLAVEAAVRAYARKYGEDEELWGAVGLIHDFDYEQNPTLDRHPMVGCEILRKFRLSGFKFWVFLHSFYHFLRSWHP